MALCTNIKAEIINIGTWNIRINIKPDSLAGNLWSNRSEVIVQMIRFYDFDILGLQEDFTKELNELNSNLPEYKRVGFPNHENGKVGTFNSIFYKTSTASIIDSGMFYLSPIEDRPNIGWNGKYIRSCTWAKFKIKNSKRILLVLNTHTDYAGGEVEMESTKMLIRKIKQMSTDYTDAILMGDLNFNQFSPGYKILNDSDILEDCFTQAPIKLATNGTFNRYDPDYYANNRIDHIFSTQKLVVKKYGILTDSYWHDNKNRLPSDHYPVFVQMQIK